MKKYFKGAKTMITSELLINLYKKSKGFKINRKQADLSDLIVLLCMYQQNKTEIKKVTITNKDVLKITTADKE